MSVTNNTIMQAKNPAPRKTSGVILQDEAAKAKAKALQKARDIATGRNTSSAPVKSFDPGQYNLEATYLPYNPKKGKRAGQALTCIGWEHASVPFFNVMLKYRDHLKIALLVLETVEAGGGEHLRNCILAELKSTNDQDQDE